MVQTLLTLSCAASRRPAEARGGRPGGGPGPVERITVQENRWRAIRGDSRPRGDRLPAPSYGPTRPGFPALLLHLRDGRYLTERLARLQESADRLAPVQGFSELIVVTPNAYTLHKGSMYSNSPVTGDWETFIAEDLVAHIDRNYRTFPDRMSRGLAGHSMGGYGALRIGMKRPEVFSSLYIIRGLHDGEPQPQPVDAASAATRRASSEEARVRPGRRR